MGRTCVSSTGAAAVGTRARHGHVVGLIDHGWDAPTPLSPIRRSRFGPGRRGCALGAPFENGAALAEAGAPRGVELPCATARFSRPQSLPLALNSLQLRAQSGLFLTWLFDQIAGNVRPSNHATVMPELWIQYKSNRVGPVTKFPIKRVPRKCLPSIARACEIDRTCGLGAV